MFRHTTVRMCAIALLLVGLIVLPIMAQEKTKLTIGLPASHPGVHPEKILESFIANNPDIEVEPLNMDWKEFFNKIAVMLASGTAPDVWYGEAGRAIGWYHNKATIDLLPFVERDLNQSHYFFLHAARDPFSGAWTGIPGDFQVTTLFYNVNHFSDHGLAFPDAHWTVDDFVEAAKRLKVVKDGACPERYGFNMQPTQITKAWMLWPRLMGGKILNETRTGSKLTAPRDRGRL